VSLTFDVDGIDRVVEPEVLVVAGYTGADQVAVQHHVDELAAEGVAPPPNIPMYWTMSPTSLTQESAIVAPSAFTSGEVELALVVDGNEMLLAIGSDHTCREAEAIDIRLSKMICPTPISSSAWRWAGVSDHWAELQLRSSIDATGKFVSYQDAPAGGNRSPVDLLAGIPWARQRPGCFVLLCGTAPTIGGIRPADRFRGRLVDARGGRELQLDYSVQAVPGLS
jgi:hypothetical protein